VLSDSAGVGVQAVLLEQAVPLWIDAPPREERLDVE
jgi:hypothetical protein